MKGFEITEADIRARNAHNAKVARDAQAGRTNPRPVRKLNEERPKKPSICAQEPAVAVLEPKSTTGSRVWRFEVAGNPCPAPRQTRSDKWRKRPCVLRYREWCDRARASAPSDMTKDPMSVEIAFFIEMPKSWSHKKRYANKLEPHRQKFDIDNGVKAVLDALFKSDCMISFIEASKRWAGDEGPCVAVTVRNAEAYHR